jgi:hypothetical protein
MRQVVAVRQRARKRAAGSSTFGEISGSTDSQSAGWLCSTLGVMASIRVLSPEAAVMERNHLAHDIVAETPGPRQVAHLRVF